jgi:ABC-type lipoprotein export system ATPase subunit
VIVVSHDQRLLKISSRVVWIEDGKISERRHMKPRRALPGDALNYAS